MTTLTQSELDAIRHEATKFGAIAQFTAKAILFLLDHIAQLTAELNCRDALIKDHLGKIMHLENRVDAEAFRAETAKARIAGLEAALLKTDALQDLAYANGAHYALVASNGGAPEEKIMAMISDRRHSSLVELKKLRENPGIVELEAQSSAQFVAGMREALRPFANEAAEWVDDITDDDFRPTIVADGPYFDHGKAKFTIGDLRRARAILAEAALKGDGTGMEKGAPAKVPLVINNKEETPPPKL